LSAYSREENKLRNFATGILIADDLSLDSFNLLISAYIPQHMGNFRSTPPPGALKEGSTKPESISPRRGKTPPEPVIQSALEQEKIQALKEIFIKMKSSPEQRTVSEEEFLVIIYFVFGLL
jgi:hypothetical protein